MQEKTIGPRAERTEVPDGAESVRLADVLTFLEIYAKADTASVDERVNFSVLLSRGPDPKNPERKHGLTTRVSQLERIVDFLFGKGEAKRTGLHRLFEKDHLGGLVPSKDARIVYKHFVVLRDIYRNIKLEIDDSRNENRTQIIRVGAPQTIGMRLLSSILSDRQRLLPEHTRLEVEIANSHDLIRRLKSRLLDVVIAYGQQEESGKIDAKTGLMFLSLGYQTRLVLLCPPTAQLWVRPQDNGVLQDINRGYWEESFHGMTRRTLPPYERLRKIDLESIDFRDKPLIVVNSWHQPKALDSFVRSLPPDRIMRVQWYEEALALVRMGEGFAITAEVFSRRVRVTAFRLDRDEQFERRVGAYFHPPENLLSDHVRHFMQIVREYMNFCKDEMRSGEPPSFGDEKYSDFCKYFNSLLQP